MIVSALYAEAALAGWDALYSPNIPDIPKNLSALIKSFRQLSDEFVKKMLANRKPYYSLADWAGQFIVDYPRLSTNLAIFFNDLALPRQSKAADNFYRVLLSPDEVAQIDEQVEADFLDAPDNAKIRIFRARLAESAIKDFVLSAALKQLEPSAHGGEDNRRIVAIGSEDIEASSSKGLDHVTMPSIMFGKRRYSIHVLNDRGKLGFAFWKAAVPMDEKNYHGALLFSFKEYPTGDYLVRFDNYIQRNDLEIVLKKAKAKELAFLDFNEPCYAYDQRDKFIEVASVAAIEEAVETAVAAETLVVTNVDSKRRKVPFPSGKKCPDPHSPSFSGKRKTKKISAPGNKKDPIAILRPSYLKDRRGIPITHLNIIPLFIFSKAADSLGVLDEQFIEQKIKSITCDAWIIQKRKEILLLVSSRDKKPNDLIANGTHLDFNEAGLFLYEAMLGNSESIPEFIEIGFSLNGESISFNVQFKKPE